MLWLALISSVVISSTRLVVLYDNASLRSGFKSSWGFACYVEHRGTKVLFDTGSDWRILKHNAASASIAFDELDGVFISHLHADHVGCIDDIAALNRRLKFALPASGSDALARRLRGMGHEVVQVRKPVELWSGLISTGELYGPPYEQALIVRGDGWMALIVGCSHPGVDRIAAKAHHIAADDFLLVLGGFHLLSAGRDRIEAIARELSELGVKRIAPCHCTGRTAVSIFKKKFPNACITCGAGLTLELP